MENKFSRPEIEGTVSKLHDYNIVMIGFPVWWYTLPAIINTFIESLDLTGKTLIPFCTSGITGIEGCEKDLKETYPKYIWKSGKRLNGREDKEFLEKWILD